MAESTTTSTTTAEKSPMMMTSSMPAPSAGSSSFTTPPPPIDDDFDDNACSICLEPFSLSDPSTVTACKHEYHLHCILEWLQRSKECPICWQSLALKDPSSQELLAVVELERKARRRNVTANEFSNGRHYEGSDSVNGSQWTNDSDFNERIMRHLAAMMSRARQAHRNERHRSSERSPSPVLMFPSRASDLTVHPNTPEEWCSAYGSSGGSSPTSSISSLDAQPALSPSPFANMSSGSVPKRDIRYNSGSFQSQFPDNTQRPRSSELLAFSETVKSRLTAASARYKDSISKGTQGFREKFLARNNSVKELSKGVQREMNASIAGVAKMIERLDLKSKRQSHVVEGQSNAGESSNFFTKGKGVLDNIIANSRENRVVTDQGIISHQQSQATCSIPSHKDTSYAQRGN